MWTEIVNSKKDMLNSITNSGMKIQYLEDLCQLNWKQPFNATPKWWSWMKNLSWKALADSFDWQDHWLWKLALALQEKQ